MTAPRSTDSGNGKAPSTRKQASAGSRAYDPASGETTPLYPAVGKSPDSPEMDHALHRLASSRSGGDLVPGDGDDAGERLLGPGFTPPGGEAEEVVIEGEDRATPFVWVLVGAAAISGLLFGYDTGVISGMLVVMGTDLGTALTDWQKEMITSATTLGALLGGLSAGALSDYTGRKPVIAMSNAVFILGALLQAASHTVSTMIAGRFIVGLGVGLASCIIPLYIGELSPTKIRGQLVTVNAVTVTFGQVVAYAIGTAFSHVPGGWRWMVGVGALPSIVQLLALAVLPESPRILLLRSKVDETRQIMAQIYPLASERDLEAKLQAMAFAVKQSTSVGEDTTWSEKLATLFNVGMNRRALIIGCGLQAAQQLCGFNTLMYYSASIFAALGFRNATAVGCLIAMVNFGFTLVALKVIDPLGRRRTMLYTLPWMVLALVLSSVFFYLLTRSTDGILLPGSTYSTPLSSLLIASMLLYVAAYATGLGCIPWQQGELFRLDVRGMGTSICTATNWTCNLIVAATFLSLMRVATPAGAFAIYAGFCAASWGFCWRLYPETSGLSLEEVCALFEDDFGVEKSERIRREKRAHGRLA